ncbi:MAG: isoprenyl transferase [Peptococcaceae bacterium]|nr:isoprenyl transferase [Peptococcaceae bacterium]
MPNNNIDKQVPISSLPRHIAIIMDGNGRWAQRRGLPRSAGHKAGADAVERIVRACVELEIPVLTVYAFSTENWKRPAAEVSLLMQLLLEYLQRKVKIMATENIKICFLGERDNLPEKVKTAIERTEVYTQENTGLIFNIALNYGGQQEILHGVKEVAAAVAAGECALAGINQAFFAQHLYTKGLPEVDLMIRTSGEQRISNFLLWQMAYAELYFTETYWPDFDKEALLAAITAYGNRERRLGGLK